MTYKIFYTNNGVATSELNITWQSLNYVGDGLSITPQPSFSAVSNGWYKFNFSPSADAVGVVDGSSAISASSERYIPVDFSTADNNITNLDTLVSTRSTFNKSTEQVVVSAMSSGVITNATFAAGAINAAALSAGALNSQTVQSVTNPVTVNTYQNFPQVSVSAMATGVITTATFTAGAIDAAAIADNAIDAGAIAANAITNAKIATGAITNTQFAAGAINAAVLSAGALNSQTINNVTSPVTVNTYQNFPQVSVSAISSGVITNSTFAENAIDATAIADNAIDVGAIAAGAITNTKFAAGAINATVLSAGAMNSQTINTVTSPVTVNTYQNFPQVSVSALGTGVITSTTFAAGAIDATVVADNTIDSGAIAAGALVSQVILGVTNPVSVSAINSNVIGQSQIASGTVFVSDVQQIMSSSAAASNLSKSALVMVQGTITSASVAPTDQQFEATGMTDATTGHYNGRIIVFTTGNLTREVCEITNYAYQNTNGLFTVRTKTTNSHLISIPSHGDTFIII